MAVEHLSEALLAAKKKHAEQQRNYRLRQKQLSKEVTSLAEELKQSIGISVPDSVRHERKGTVHEDTSFFQRQRAQDQLWVSSGVESSRRRPKGDIILTRQVGEQEQRVRFEHGRRGQLYMSVSIGPRAPLTEGERMKPRRNADKLALGRQLVQDAMGSFPRARHAA